MPRFVSIFTGNIENVKLSSYSQEKNNNVFINFDKNIKEIFCSAFYDEDKLDEIPCTVVYCNPSKSKKTDRKLERFYKEDF